LERKEKIKQLQNELKHFSTRDDRKKEIRVEIEALERAKKHRRVNKTNVDDGLDLIYFNDKTKISKLPSIANNDVEKAKLASRPPSTPATFN
jgi:hypothetical protein